MNSLVSFLKNPVYEEERAPGLKYRLNVICKLLALALLLSLALAMLIGIVAFSTGLELGQHAVDLFLKTYPAPMVFLAAVLLGPVLEELIFRAPLVFFRNSRLFPLVFYTFTAVFGFYHITNFSLSTEIILLSPLLVSPQLCIGLILGYVRVRFGLLWAMAMHASYNAVLICPFLIMKYLDLPLLWIM